MYANIATLIKDSRTKKNISQDQLATRLGLTSPQYISNVEREICGMSPECLANASKILGVKKEHLRDAALADYAARLNKKMGLK